MIYHEVKKFCIASMHFNADEIDEWTFENNRTTSPLLTTSILFYKIFSDLYVLKKCVGAHELNIMFKFNLPKKVCFYIDR